MGDRIALIAHRLERAKQTAVEARFNLDNNFLNLAENRIYYAMFYAVSALALKCDFITSKHSQLKGWFNKEFIATQKIDPLYYKIYNRAFERRQEGDYDDFASFDKEEVEEDIKNMNLFLEMLFSFMETIAEK